MTKSSSRLPSSEHFELHQVAGGVYAAIAAPGGAAFSNAGIIDLGDRTLIFDTFETHIAARDLKRAALQLTGRTPDTVVISHAHDDHWLGNQVFAEDAIILSTHAIRESMQHAEEELLEFKEDPSELEEWIRNDEERLASEKDELLRAAIRNRIARWEHTLAMLPDLQIQLPDLTFESKVVFHGSQRSAELISHGPGHTASDCYLVLPSDRLAFLGDLAFFRSQPFMVYCDPQAWMRQLEDLEQSPIEVYIPGHGPVGDRSDLAMIREYILRMEELVSEIIGHGGTVDQALALTLPDPFRDWQHVETARFEANIRSIFDRLTAMAAGDHS